MADKPAHRVTQAVCDSMNAQMKKVLDSLQPVFEEERKVSVKVRRMVEVILGDIDGCAFKTPEDYLQKRAGYSKEQLSKMSKFEKLRTAYNLAMKEPTGMQNLVAALTLLFGERYGWTEEQIWSMTSAETYEALLHALDYTPPGKRSILDL